MDAIFGFVGEGFVLLAADQSAQRSIMAYKHDEDKIRPLDSHKMVASAGPQADCTQFVEYVQRNVALNEYRTGLKLSTKAATSYVRTELAAALRKNPYQVNMLIGGYDAAGAGADSAASASGGASLYFMDYLGSSTKLNYGAHGYCAYFILSTMDAHWKPGMSVDEAVALARMCIKELGTRFIIHMPKYKIKVADKDGVREIPLEAA